MLETTFIEACARAALEVNRVYCLAIGEAPTPTWLNAQQWQRDAVMNGVRGALNGDGPEQSHESWMAEKVAAGWVYGPEKDPEKKTHPCMVPYADLPEAQKMKDHLYLSTVRAMAHALKGA